MDREDTATQRWVSREVGKEINHVIDVEQGAVLIED
jgi:hypothetical protein